MSVFEGVLVFFRDVGVYEVVLPFLLVFTLVYALLEKTKVLGVEKVGDQEFSRRNANSMIAFVAGFFVVASTQLVAVINEVVANMVLLLILLICFMLLVGSMHKETKEGFELSGWTKHAFYAIMFVGMILIFLNALGWLQLAWDYLAFNWDSQFVGIIMLFAAILGLMLFVMHTPSDKKDEKKG